jgi:hypothetical protein
MSRANSNPPRPKRPPAIKRIIVGKRPPCSRCGKHPAMTGRRICVGCRDRVSNDCQPLQSQIIPIPRSSRRDSGSREDVNQTKYGEETT